MLSRTWQRHSVSGVGGRGGKGRQLSPFHPAQRLIELDCTHLPVLRFPKEIASPALTFVFLMAARIHSEASMLAAMRSGGISILFDQVGFR